MPSSVRKHGGYGGIGDDPCPMCGRSYTGFFDTGADQIVLPGSIEYCVLVEARANYEPGVYVHEDVDGGGPA